jgi:hypothetical protein
LVFKFFGFHFEEKLNGKFLLTSLKTLPNSTVDFFPEAASEFLSSFSSLPLVNFTPCFSAIGRFSPVYSTYHSRLPEKFSAPQAVSCKHSQDQIASEGPLARGDERIFKINK